MSNDRPRGTSMRKKENDGIEMLEKAYRALQSTRPVIWYVTGEYIPAEAPPVDDPDANPEPAMFAVDYGGSYVVLMHPSQLDAFLEECERKGCVSKELDDAEMMRRTHANLEKYMRDKLYF